ncbi:MAG: DUF6318 family protein [Cellulomonas sp.]
MLSRLIVPVAVPDRPPRGSSPRGSVIRAAGIALVGVAVATLTGCTGTSTTPPAATTTTTSAAVPSATPSPTPSPTSTPPPVRPAAMDEVSVDGAIATATYFLQLFPYALNTGDLTDWNGLSHPECIFCAGLSDEVKRQTGLEEHQVGLATSIASATGVEVTPGSWFDVDLRLTQGPWIVVDPVGNVVEQSAATKNVQVHMNVIRSSGHWLIRGAHTDLIEN